MQPITFKQCNASFAKNQDQYIELPVFRTTDGMVISCWKMTWKERLKAAFTGKIFLTLLTFNYPLQPQLLQVDSPFTEE